MNVEVTEDDIERVAAERLLRAYSRGWSSGSRDTLRELERLGCFTTTQAKRHVERVRARLGAEGEQDA